MKKLLLILTIFLIGVHCYASDIFPLSSSNIQPVNGVVKCRGKSDNIILNAKTRVFDTGLLKDKWFSSDSSNKTIAALFYDPYYIKIDGITYVMMIDNKDGKWTKDNILGINDSKYSLFYELKGLESDGDRTKISANELKQANIRLVKLENNETLLVKNRKTDFDINKIDYIDMRSLRKIANSDNNGIAGYFNVYIKTADGSKKMIIGIATLDSEEKINYYFK